MAGQKTFTDDRRTAGGRPERVRPMTQEQDIVLIHLEDQPLSFARIEDIQPDHKPGWYHVRLLLLQIPLQVVTWILRDVYIDGQEFTMNGKRLRLERVESPSMPEPEDEPPPLPREDRKGNGKVIALSDLKKK
jgi:hypothetical protein